MGGERGDVPPPGKLEGRPPPWKTGGMSNPGKNKSTGAQEERVCTRDVNVLTFSIFSLRYDKFSLSVKR